jgi:pimeloyl-ACP methyl ester carboxylesterase
MRATAHGRELAPRQMGSREPSRFVRLADGVTHFRCDGPVGGTPIVLIHGATVPCWEFDEVAPPLTAAGFRTLRFDLFGHGLSDRPRGDYSLERFTRQTCEVIEATGFPRPAALLGHSLGAAIAAAVAAANPQWVERLVLVAPMLDFNSTSAWSRLFRVALFGDVLMRVIGVPGLVRRRRIRYAGIGMPHLTPLFIEHATRAGFGRALLSMIRTGTLSDQSARYAALRDLDRDLLLVSGARDAVIPAAHIARVRQLLPSHRHVEIPDAEHNLLLTHPLNVVEALCGPRVSPAPSIGAGDAMSGP